MQSGYSSKGTDSFIRGISGYSVSNKEHCSNPECIWINHYDAVDEIRRKEKGCIVQFHDESELFVSVDVRCIRRSMQLCKRYLSFLNA